jgi:hypothetical protein
MSMPKEHKKRISKKEYLAKGDFANSNLYRKHNGRHWEYYEIVPNRYEQKTGA